jgi:PAS domain S-box-containing protein
MPIENAPSHIPLAGVGPGAGGLKSQGRTLSVAGLALFGAALFFCAVAGLYIGPQPAVFVNFWLPCGLYAGVLLRTPSRDWPRLVAVGFAATVAFDLWNGQSLGVSLQLGAGDSLGAFTSAWLMRRFVAARPDLSKVGEVVGLIGYCALLGPMINASVAFLHLVPTAGTGRAPSNWLYWWSGDVMGVLMVTPLVLTWPRKLSLRTSWATRLEWVAYAGVALSVVYLAFRDSSHAAIRFEYLIVPCVLWSSIRLGTQATALTNLFVAGLAAWLTSRDPGAMAAVASNTDPIASLQLFLFVVAFTGLFLGAALAERMRAQATLHTSESQLRQLIEDSPAMLAMFDLEMRYIYVSRRWMRDTGLDYNNVRGRSHYEIFPDIPERWKAIHRRGLAGEVIRTEDDIHEREEGSVTWISWEVRPWYDASGAIGGIHVFADDLTDRKRAADTLRESEAKFASIFRGAPVWIAIRKLGDGKYVEVNDQLLRDTGYSRAEVIGRTAEEVGWISGDNVSDWTRATESGRAISSIELVVRAKDGRLLHSIINGESIEIGGRQCLLTVGVDISARKQAEAALRESEEMFSRAFRDAPVLIAISDLETGRYLEVNEKCVSLTGYRREEIIGKTGEEVGWHRRDEREHRKTLLQQNGRIVDLEVTLKKKGGELLHCIYSGNLVTIGGRNCLLSISQDITARKIAEDRVGTLSKALIQSPVSILVTNARGEVEYANPAFTKASGYTQEEAIGRSPQFLKGGAASDNEYRQILSAIEQGREWRGELHNRKKSGELYWENTHISPIRDAHGTVTHFLEVDEDITRRKLMEEQLQKTQKLDAIGQLTGGIAHDFNNVLAAISINLGLLLGEENIDEKTKEVLSEMLSSAQRAATMTRQLLVFSRQSVFEKKPVDLGELVGSSLKMLERLIGENITLKFDQDANLPVVEADPGMIDQVIMNLVLNARDAMPKGGTVTVGLAKVEIDGNRAGPESLERAGRYVRLSVEDTGCGMDDATLRRIFEPFFTTKASNVGTGLGLATVHGVVTRHKGWVSVRSRKGEGSIFEVYLPSTNQARAEAAPAAKAGVTAGSETILLVEDDVSIRRVVAKCLKRWGYTVIEAEDGTSAMNLWPLHRGQIELVITDMMMPGGLNGLELAQALRRESPDLKVIITSGYAIDLAREGSPIVESVRFLQKPYEIDTLAKSIRSYVDGS